jgi:hypothetical protein
MIDVFEADIIPGKWVTRCHKCTAFGLGIYNTAVQAARAWNKRYDFKTKSATLYGKSVKE